MYEQVFNLTSRPFTSIHYVKHYFPAEAIDQSLQQTKMLVERGSGPVVIVGDHGTGKTLLLAILEENFKAQFRIVNISASLLRSREDLLQNILFQLQMNCRGLGENEMRLDLVEMLKKDTASGILLLIDDAQKLTVESVEEMQLLTDFIHDGQPRVRLVLAGSQGVEERLADNRLVSFTQRIAGRFFLSSLNRSEVEQYVRTHVERAGGKPDELFSPESFKAVHEVSEGRPRYINQVCDHAMIFAATRGTVPITDTLVREAWYDIQKLPGCVAPSGSGAATSNAPASVQSIETDSDGWTVLEFGELSDSDAESFQSKPVNAEAQLPKQQPKPIPGPTLSVKPTSDTAATQDASDQPEAAPTATGAPNALGGAAILATAMAGFGVAAGNNLATTSDAEAGDESPAEDKSPSSEITKDSEVPPTIESIQSVTTEVKSADQQEPTDEPTSVFEDPFASDDYENEEVLVDAYSPFVAQQNQRSLDVTSEQLQNLTPGETVQWNESSDSKSDSTPVEEETFPTSETAVKPPEPVRETQKPTVDPRETADTRIESSLLGPDSLSEEFAVNRHAALLSDGPTSPNADATSVNLEPLEAKPGSGFVPIDPDASQVPSKPEVPHLVDSATLNTSAAVAPKPAVTAEKKPVQKKPVQKKSVQKEPVQEKVPATKAPDSVPAIAAASETASSPKQKFHEQAPSPDDPEIRKQAEDIIRSLGANVGSSGGQVSHETPSASLSIQEETNAIEDSIQRSAKTQPTAGASAVAAAAAAAASSVVLPNLDQIKNALKQAQDRQGLANVPTNPDSSTAVAGQIPVQIAGVDPVETDKEILNEVREQSAFITDVVSRNKNQPSSKQPVAGQDDRAILDVNQDESATDEVAAAESQEAPMPAWSQQEPSQGEAARVDYQRLFDQLRNVQDNQE